MAGARWLLSSPPQHGSADSWIDKARASLEEGDADAAFESATRAIEIAPASAVAHFTLGAALQRRSEMEAARDEYRRASSLDPAYLSAQAGLGVVSYVLGELDDARQAFATASSIDPKYPPALVGSMVSSLEHVYASEADLHASRARYTEALHRLVDGLADAPIERLRSAAEVLPLLPTFHLAYQGQNDRELQETYGRLVARVFAAVVPKYAGPVPTPPRAAGGRLRIGLLSAFFREHSNWKIPIRGWVESIDRSRFELYGYDMGQQPDATTAVAQDAFEHWRSGTRSLSHWCRTIRDDDLHALIIPEIGMDGRTLQVAALRLAPVQISSWGHPQTSGLPTIDYFLSSDAMEPPDGDSHYTETLVRLPNLSIHYTPPRYEAENLSRDGNGIDDDAIVFWCCQSTSKYLPGYDSVFTRIAAQVPKSVFVFIQSPARRTTETLRSRLGAAFAQAGLDASRHCLFLPRMSPNEFAGATRLADIFLDSLGWSGCNSTLEAIAHDLPVVTMAGETMRSRHSAAILRQIGLSDWIAPDQQSYVDMAVRLAKDGSLRRKTSQRIAAEKHRLYGDETPVRALERFLIDAVERAGITTATDAAAELRSAREAHRAGRMAEAESAYRRVLSLHAGHPDAKHGLAVLLLQLGRHQQAEDILRGLVREHPQSAETWVALAQALSARNERAEAMSCYETALAARPSWAEAHQMAARNALELERREEALELARKAAELAPDNGPIQADLALILQSLERFEESAAAYRRGLSLVNPKYAAGAANPRPTVQEMPQVPSRETVQVGISHYPKLEPVAEPPTRPFWSVVIPAYNRKLYLLQGLASVLAAWGGPEDIEIIVVDNGSAEPLHDLIDSIGVGIVRSIRHPKTVPLQANWNSAVRASRGKWIHLLHDDDYVLPGFYQTLRQRLEACPDTVGGAFVGYQHVNEHGVPLHYKKPFGDNAGIAHDWLEVIGVGNVLTPPSMVIKREAYEKLGAYSEDILYTVDWELYIRVASFYDWWYEPAPMVHYRRHGATDTEFQNVGGAQGASFRKAIEMSASYLPADRQPRITANARANIFEWCVRHLAPPLRAGNLRGALMLTQEALRIESSDRSALRLFHEVSEDYAADLKNAIAEAHIAESPPEASAVDQLFGALLAPDAQELRRQVAAALLALEIQNETGE